MLRDGSARCGRRGLGGAATQGGGHFTVDKVRVLAGNDGAGFAPLRVGGDHIDIKFLVDVVGQCDCYVSAGDILFAGLYTLGRHVAQHFQAVGRVADEHTECDGDGESHHIGAGNADAHGVFENVGAEANVHFVGRSGRKLLGRTSRGECHANRFGTTDGGHHLFAHEGDDFLSEGFRKHGIGVGIGAG